MIRRYDAPMVDGGKPVPWVELACDGCGDAIRHAATSLDSVVVAMVLQTARHRGWRLAAGDEATCVRCMLPEAAQ